jgi:hypothetical protein
VPLILYPNAPRPSYADQVLSFYRKLGLKPKVGFEVRELQTALGLVAADVGIALVPSSVRRLGRDDVQYVALDEPEITSPIIMSFRPNDRSPLLADILKLAEFDHAPPRNWLAPRPDHGPNHYSARTTGSRQHIARGSPAAVRTLNVGYGCVVLSKF